MDLSLALCLDNKLLKYIDGSACNPVIVPVFKTGGWHLTVSPVGSTPTRFRHFVSMYLCSGGTVFAAAAARSTGSPGPECLTWQRAGYLLSILIPMPASPTVLVDGGSRAQSRSQPIGSNPESNN